MRDLRMEESVARIGAVVDAMIALDFTRFLSGGFNQTLENIGRNAL